MLIVTHTQMCAMSWGMARGNMNVCVHTNGNCCAEVLVAGLRSVHTRPWHFIVANMYTLRQLKSKHLNCIHPALYCSQWPVLAWRKGHSKRLLWYCWSVHLCVHNWTFKVNWSQPYRYKMRKDDAIHKSPVRGTFISGLLTFYGFCATREGDYHNPPCKRPFRPLINIV